MSAYASRSATIADDLLDQRPSEGRPDDEHLPAGLDVDAGLDEQLGEVVDLAGRSCRGIIKRTYCFVKWERAAESEAEKTARRERILEGARRCFARYGYEGATVVRLEQEIGLSRGAIFNWFGSKEELFFELAARDNERLIGVYVEEGFEAIFDALLEGRPGLARRLPRVRSPAAHRRRAPRALEDDRPRRSPRAKPRWIEEAQVARPAPDGCLGPGDRAILRRRPRRDRRPAGARLRRARAGAALPADARRDQRGA